MTRRVAVALAALLAVLGLRVPAGAAPKPCPPGQYVDCGVTGNGTTYDGVVIFPGWQSGSGASGTGGTSTCAGCEWTYVPACWVNSPDNGADALCGAAVNSCPARGEDGILMWVYVKRPGEDWERVGTACVGGANKPLSLADLRVDAARVYRDQMRPGAATISPQPANGPWVVNLTSYFMATGVSPMSRTFGPNGARMTIDATPTYVWDWGDGSDPLETRSAGGPHPDGDVTHVYRAKGHPTVTLTTRWQATFTVVTGAGTYGPFDVGGTPVAPSTTRTIDVREARAELVSR